MPFDDTSGSAGPPPSGPEAIVGAAEPVFTSQEPGTCVPEVRTQTLEFRTNPCGNEG